MAEINFNKCEFIKSATESKQFINSSCPTIVFAGKSNVGKSSVINKIINRKNFARVGNTPGKTIHVNYFLIDKKIYFVDLPGYGFANVSKDEKYRWSKLMESFFSTNESFTYGVLIVDSRHAPTKDDISMCDYFKNSGKRFLVLANKIDKVKKSNIENNLNLIKYTLNLNESNLLVPFSAEKGTGKELLVAELIKFC